ncbi:fumarate hydratase class I, putative [Trypanosoma brucei gambiense DAL972]|uniref:fumarate hydratase n=3 Tax=Trypanosoma brucei TaxID=5691 RepID=Q385R3_TRYB2|nr:fumarate hydratase class I, putative [Trypanosoma brucei gambiense DAL972]XP_828580.1 fumarate hydratase class I, putative [Trypanosoma brucei brucei TREU927]EAN79468.1 fumarate hydratase class I, putative [Trypanosoma brucei brucei TREU927]RHW67208.1 fumarate hydratase [Trypanosoma brucei equiperdum]CBH17452.1 fumarate hydratase class I, putative [Trypanosoma brucei gambiense DAL972]|eukprot:XP_011779716.1 fumarate hydratase class I, putative [Trypanosoma brucei gambiense DAL972]
MLRRSSLWFAPKSAPPFKFVPLLPHLHHKDTEYTLVTKDYVSVVNPGAGLPEILKVEAAGLTLLASRAIGDVQHFLRPSHLASLRSIFEDPEASDNDRFVALQLIKNANIAAARILPGCQDTGTAIIAGYKGEQVFTNGDDEEALSRGVHHIYTTTNLRYSQNVPLTMYDEKNTGCNLPAQIDLYATKGCEYEFFFVAKGGGSANKAFLFQETKSVLNPKSLRNFLEEKISTIGTSACPPYHMAVVVGGTSAEMTMKAVKYASCKYLDELPTKPDESKGYTYRDLEMEQMVMDICRNIGMGAQFGGKYFAHDARVIRMPRHGASCPIGIGVSCSADRQALAKINKDGIWVEKLEMDPAKYLPEVTEDQLLKVPPVKIDLNMPMDKIRAELSRHPVKTRLSLTGTIIVARDIAHARMREMLENNKPLPDYIKNHPVYYAGPAKRPEALASGSFGPTTAGRMDPFVDLFQANGGSFVMLAKGNRSKRVTEACKKYGGFYLGSIGGPAALLAMDSIRKVEVLDMEELGMEAVWKIEVENFPAFIVVDDKGNDFFQQLR